MLAAELGPGGPRLRAHRACRHAASRGSRSSTSSTASGPRTRSTRSPSSRRTTSGHWSVTMTSWRPDARGLTPDAPVVRGTAQNPDVFFQAREASNPYHLAVPGIVQDVMDELAMRTGRHYGLVDYHGAPDADRVVIVMGSAGGAVEETVDTLVAAGEKVGMLRIRLFQPFPAEQIIAALPPTVRSIAVLDRTKEPGAVGEPLYLDGRRRRSPKRWTATIRRSRAAPSGHRRPLRAVLQGDHAVDDQADLRRARRARDRNAISRSASTTMSPTSACRSTARSRFRARRRSPGGLLRARLGRHRGRQQGLGQDHRREHRSVRAGLLRLRLQEVRVDDRLPPAVRSRAHPFDLPRRGGGLRGLPPVRVARAGRGCSSPPSTARPSCSMHRTVRTRSGTACPVACSACWSTRSIDFWVIDAYAVADEAGMGRPYQHRHATVLLPARRRPAARGGDRADQGIRREDVRQAGRGRRRRATSPPSTVRSSASVT